MDTLLKNTDVEAFLFSSEKSNLLMKGKPLRLKILLHDIGKQVKERKFLRGRNRGTCTVSTSKKPSATDKKIQKTGIKRPLKPKAKYTARKSAGSVKKRPPSQRKQGKFSKIKM